MKRPKNACDRNTSSSWSTSTVFQLPQIAEELEVTGRGSGHARADYVIWRSGQDRTDGKNPLVVVECKSDNVTIRPADCGQSDNYTRLTGALLRDAQPPRDPFLARAPRPDAEIA
jgi:hypothetical protein